MEQTLAILKPDCVQRKLVGKVIDLILQNGFHIVALQMVHLRRETAGGFYAVHRERPFFASLVEFMCSGQCIPLVLEKENAVTDFRKLIGATDPTEAAPGTVRQLFAASKQSNIVHGSDSVENAKNEIAFFFPEKTLIENR
jgi:nucleoside-diphosphate kinase